MNIKKFIRHSLKTIYIIIISILLFLIIDFFFGKILIAKYIDQIKDNPYYLKNKEYGIVSIIIL